MLFVLPYYASFKSKWGLRRELWHAPSLALQDSACLHAAHLAVHTWLGICCPHLAAHESCCRRMCLCCHLLVKPDSHLRTCQLQNSHVWFVFPPIIQPRDNRSWTNWVRDQGTWAAQSKFHWDAWRGLELQEVPSGTLYSYGCQHFCLWALIFFQHA